MENELYDYIPITEREPSSGPAARGSRSTWA